MKRMSAVLSRDVERAEAERCKAAAGYAPALECGSPSLREGFPAVLVLVARVETRSAHFVRCTRTIDASQITKRAARAATSPAVLGAAYVAAGTHPTTALQGSVVFFDEKHERLMGTGRGTF